jgi:sulfate adenylyltransferase large subunit
MKKHVTKLVFVGHVDHGKSTLIGRTLLETGSLPKETYDEVKRVSHELGKDAELAYLTDYLQEERERNITIDTTQIYFRTKKNDYVIIDAPGHVQFIKNMLSGASQAEAAVLLVDAWEGIREQTKRHAYLIHLLGIKRLIVVVNKMDRVDYDRDRFYAIKTDIIDLMNQLSLTPLHIVPASARLGENISKSSPHMGWYGGPVFTDALDRIKLNHRHENKPFRFPVQDVLEKGNDSILLGRVESGCVKQNQKLLVLPEGAEARVRDVMRYGERRRKARTGESIGIVLQNHSTVQRGVVLTHTDQKPVVSNNVSVTVFWLDNVPLHIGDTLTLQCSTQSVTCQLQRVKQRIDSSTLKLLEEHGETVGLNEVGNVVLTLERPIVVDSYAQVPELGRLVLRKKDVVCAAGIVQSL